MAETVNNIVMQSLWVGAELSKVEQLCIRSFFDHGHDFHLYVYQEVAGVPPGTTLVDAGSVLPQDAIFSFHHGWGKGSYAGFADHFSVELIHQHGGWWVDMDMVCLRSFDVEQDVVICSSYEGEHGVLVNSNTFKMPAGSRLTGECLNRLRQLDIKKTYFGELGPLLFQRVVQDLNLEKEVIPYHFFNPIHWRYTKELVLGMQDFCGLKSRSGHLCGRTRCRGAVSCGTLTLYTFGMKYGTRQIWIKTDVTGHRVYLKS